MNPAQHWSVVKKANPKERLWVASTGACYWATASEIEQHKRTPQLGAPLEFQSEFSEGVARHFAAREMKAMNLPWNSDEVKAVDTNPNAPAIPGFIIMAVIAAFALGLVKCTN